MHTFAFTPFIRLLVFTVICALGLPGIASTRSEAAEATHKEKGAQLNSAGIIALSASTMTWAEAKAFCQRKGGRLPLIGSSNSLSDAPKGTPIDGFGAAGAPWPAGLPSDGYWTGTEFSGSPGVSWSVGSSGGRVSVCGNHQGGTDRVVCVP